MSRTATLYLRRALAALFVLTAACEAKGCAGQKYTLVYQGPPVDERGPVLLDGVPIGYVAARATDAANQILTLAVADLSRVHEHDAYNPVTGDDGLAGLAITRVGGDRLVPGAVIYYPPLESERGPVYRKRAPGEAAKPPAAKLSPGSAFVPVPETAEGLPDPDLTVGSANDTVARRRVRRAVASLEDFSQLSQGARDRAAGILMTTVRPGNDVEAIRQAARELPALREQLERDARDAHARGNEAEARQSLEAMKRVILLQQRMGEIERDARRAP